MVLLTHNKISYSPTIFILAARVHNSDSYTYNKKKVEVHTNATNREILLRVRSQLLPVMCLNYASQQTYLLKGANQCNF